MPLQPTQPQRLGLLALGLDVGGVLVVRHLGRLQLFEQPSFNPIGVIVEFLEGLILLKLGSFQSEFSFLQRLAGRQWRRNRTGARGLGLAASSHDLVLLQMLLFIPSSFVVGEEPLRRSQEVLLARIALGRKASPLLVYFS